MKVRSKESGKVYDIDAVFVKGGELILPLNEVEVLTEDQTYDYEALRNELAAKLFTILVKSNVADFVSVGAIEAANHFISELKKSPVE